MRHYALELNPVKDPRLPLTANTYNDIVVIVDLYQVGNKLLLSDLGSVYRSSSRGLNGKANKQRAKAGEMESRQSDYKMIKTPSHLLTPFTGSIFMDIKG